MVCNLFKRKYFRDSISTITKASLDDYHNESMVISDIPVVNFDYATELYCNDKNIPKLYSDDAILPLKKNRMVLIEFKNGKITRKVKSNIYKKNIDSIFVCSDILEETEDELKEDTDYILVYNYEKNNHKQECNGNNDIEQTVEFDFIANELNSFSDSNYVAFGLKKKFSNNFKSIYTFTVPQFKNYLQKLNIN